MYMRNYQITALVVFVLLLGITLIMGTTKTGTETKQNSKNTVRKVALDENEPDGLYRVIPSESTITWTAEKELVKNYKDVGTIDIESGILDFARGSLEDADVLVDTTSITTTKTGIGGGKESLTKQLKSDNFFSVEQYPRARFTLTSATKSTEGVYQVMGDMTIRGVTNEETVTVDVTKTTKERLRLMGDMNINRTDYGIRYRSDKFFSNLGNSVIEDIFTLAFDLTLDLTPQ